MCPKILEGYELTSTRSVEPSPNGGAKGGWMIGIDGRTLVFTIFGKNYIFFVLKNYPQVCEDVSLTEPTLMGGPKGMGERCR